MKIKKGDKVKILAGKDKGRTGTVEIALEKSGQVLVAGLNIFKKHTKPRKEGEKGGIVDKSRPIKSSKVILICPKCGKTTRVGYQAPNKKDKREKRRICQKCKVEI